MVDDEVDLVRSTLGRLRKEFGEDRVQGTSDAREAASWIEMERPSAIITDLRMPHLSGLELLELAHQRWGQVPAVLMTAVPTSQVHEGASAGTFAYMPKPFAFQALREAIHKLLRAREAPAFSGAIAVTMLADVVQLYALSMPAGVLTVDSSMGQGQIFMKRGSVVHASTPSQQGAAAFFEILAWPSGTFGFSPGEAPQVSINMNLSEILLESYRRKDEGQKSVASASASPAISIDDVFAELELGLLDSAASPPAEQHPAPHLEALSHSSEAPKDKVMANNIKESLAKLEGIEGFVGAALVDTDSGMCVGMLGGNGMLNMEVAGASNAEVVRAKRKAMKALNIKDDIEDILISLGKQYHLIRPLKNRPTMFFYVAIDRAKANLAMARFALSDVEKDIVM